MTSPVELPFVSLIVPCRNEERYIGSCLDSALATDYPRHRLEVLVAEGRSDDRTREIATSYAASHPCITLVDNPQRTTPAGLNAAIRQARGEVIVRLDAHAAYPSNYLRVLVLALQETGADNVSGVLVTLPAEDRPIPRAIAVGLAHTFGVGNSHFRIGTRTRRWVNAVQFGCYRRELFDRIGLFDEELVRNQDDEFNFRLIARGGRILLLPEVECRYYARGSLRQLARMCYQYGYFKPLVARKVGRIMTLRQLVPAAFVLGLLGFGLLGLWWVPGRWLFAGIAGAYATVAAVCAVLASLRHGPGCAGALLLVFPTMHVSYGLGFLQGTIDHVLRRSGRRSPSAVPLSR
jgi:glycosyltransferase involved in cell wall biosynthesis